MSERDELVARLKRTPGWSTLGNAAADQIERDGWEIERLAAENAELAATLAECVFLLTSGRRGALTPGGDPVAKAVALLRQRDALNGEGET